MKNEFFRQLSIDKTAFSPRSIEIHWSADQKSGVMVLYQHCDNTWHLDSESRRMDREEILAVLRRFLAASLAEKPRRKPKAKPKQEYRQPIRVWRAEDVR
ncbi:MAG: hypothetical protein K6A40_10560 [Solobacterium sp.]|nr:hypothetical protein [Solobacterium sp.]